jgi:hypothetical protein
MFEIKEMREVIPSTRELMKFQFKIKKTALKKPIQFTDKDA